MVPNSVPRPLVRTNQWVIVLSVLAALVTRTPWVLAVPLVVGLMGMLFDFNPVMRFAKLFLRKTPAEYVPEDKDQQRFNQSIAVVCLLLALGSFLLHFTALGYVFSSLVLAAAFIAICGFCIGCYIHFQLWRFRNRKRRVRKS